MDGDSRLSGELFPNTHQHLHSRTVLPRSRAVMRSSSPVVLLPQAIALAAMVCVVLLVIMLLRRIVSSDTKPVPVAPSHEGHPLTVFYASQKGHGRRFADRLVVSASARGVPAVAVDLTGYDADRLVEHRHCVFIVATYAGGTPVPGTEPFFNEVAEMSRDFRVEKTLLASMSFAVFGCGNSEYPPRDFNAAARKIDRALRLLGAKRLLARQEADDIDNALSEQFEAWTPKLWHALGRAHAGTAEPVAPRRTAGQAKRLERMRKQGERDAATAEAGAAARQLALQQAASAKAAGGTPSSSAPAADECCGGRADAADCCRQGGGSGGDGVNRTAAEAGAGCGCGEGGKGGCGEGGKGGERDYAAAADHEDPSGGAFIESDDDASEHDGDGGYGSDGGEVGQPWRTRAPRAVSSAPRAVSSAPRAVSSAPRSKRLCC